MLTVHRAVDGHDHAGRDLILTVTIHRQVQRCFLVFGALGRIVAAQDAQAFRRELHLLDADADLHALPLISGGILGQLAMVCSVSFFSKALMPSLKVSYSVMKGISITLMSFPGAEAAM